MMFAPFPGAGQEKGKKAAKGKGGRGGGDPYSPYYAAPVIKGEPVGRTPDGQPDMQGFWTPRFNQAIFEVQDHPTAKPGIGPGKGAIVDPADGRIPYKPEAAAKAKELLTKQIYLEPEAHCYVSGVPHAAYQQFGYQIVQPAGYVLFLTEYAHTYRAVPTDGRPHISPNIKLFRGDSVGKWDHGTLVIDTTNQNGKTWSTWRAISPPRRSTWWSASLRSIPTTSTMRLWWTIPPSTRNPGRSPGSSGGIPIRTWS